MSPAPELRGLKVQFFGNTTLLISDGRSSILLDGFVSRPDWLRLLTTSFSPDKKRIEDALAKGKVKHVDAIFVAHSHHDHAMDVGVVAQQTGASVVGSESTLNIARGNLLADNRLIALRAREPKSIGDFRVTAYETPHSPHPIYPCAITEPLVPPTKLAAYKMGESFSFLIEHPLGRVLIVPSANFKEGTFSGVKADAVLLGMGSLGKQNKDFTETYWHETVGLSGARLVLPIHWDDFGRGLEEPLVPMPYVLDNFDSSMTRLQGLAARDGVNIRLLPVFDPTYLLKRDRKDLE